MAAPGTIRANTPIILLSSLRTIISPPRADYIAGSFRSRVGPLHRHVSTLSIHSRTSDRRIRSPAGYCSGRGIHSTSAAMAETLPEKKQVLVPMANGSEEMEIVIVADILTRAGADVTLASVEDDLQIVASRNVKLVADIFISDCEGRRYDLIVLPGGMPGAAHLRDSLVLEKLTQTQALENRLYAAICAAPAVAFESWGLLKGLKATSHPFFTEKLSNFETGSRVVRDGLATTSQGPGTGFEFALSLVDQLYGKEKLKEISTPLVLQSVGAPKSFVQEYNRQDWKYNVDGKPFQVLVPIANGSEEMEVVIIIDVLRRAGFKVIVASVENDLQILASRNVKIVADQFLYDVPELEFDMIILPGGMPGAERLRDNKTLTTLLSKQLEIKKPLGAICAAPAVVFEAKGFLKGKKATSHPAFSAKLSDQSAVDGRVVIDGFTVTSRGPGTAMEFALSIVEKVLGHSKAQSMAEAMVKFWARQAVHRGNFVWSGLSNDHVYLYVYIKDVLMSKVCDGGAVKDPASWTNGTGDGVRIYISGRPTSLVLTPAIDNVGFDFPVLSQKSFN